MTLLDLRRLSIKKQFKIRFQMRNGLECVITEHGIAQVPALKSIPDFNLEEELQFAETFLLEPGVTEKPDRKNPPKPRSIGREELAGMASGSPSGPAVDHEDD